MAESVELATYVRCISLALRRQKSGGRKTHIGWDRLIAAHTLKFPLLQNTQQRDLSFRKEEGAFFRIPECRDEPSVMCPETLSKAKVLYSLKKFCIARDFTQDENNQIDAIFTKYQYTVSFESMPIEQGIEYVRFLVDLAIGHFHFSSGFAHAPFTEKVVGWPRTLGRGDIEGREIQDFGRGGIMNKKPTTVQRNAT